MYRCAYIYIYITNICIIIHTKNTLRAWKQFWHMRTCSVNSSSGNVALNPVHCVRMRHDSFIYATWRIYMHASFISVTWLIHAMRTYATGLIHLISFIYATWPIHMGDMTHSYVRQFTHERDSSHTIICDKNPVHCVNMWQLWWWRHYQSFLSRIYHSRTFGIRMGARRQFDKIAAHNPELRGPGTHWQQFCWPHSAASERRRSTCDDCTQYTQHWCTALIHNVHCTNTQIALHMQYIQS